MSAELICERCGAESEYLHGIGEDDEDVYGRIHFNAHIVFVCDRCYNDDLQYRKGD